MAWRKTVRRAAAIAAIVLAAAGVAAAATVAVDAPATQPAPVTQPAAAVTPPGPRSLPEIPRGGRVAVIRIDGTIDLGLAPFVERVVEELGPKDLLVLDINTLGGRVDAAIVIRDALLHAEARTVCWVNPRAISAGALISLACDVIAVSPGASIGAATPIQIGDDGKAKPVEEKMVSYMRSEMRATAEANGRSGDIGEAMVDARVAIPGLDDGEKLLTLDGTQALAWGIAELLAADEGELWRGLGIQPDRIERPRISWAERLARFLTDPTIAGLLMTLGMLGIMIELYSPGHGIGLTVGLSCLAVFFFGHHIVRLAGWEEILLFVVGVGLIAFEVFVPGHIVPGIAGVLLIVLALVLALVNLEHIPVTVAWRSGSLPRAIATVMGSILATAVVSWGVFKLLPHTPFGKPLVLEAAIAARANTRASVETLAALVGAPVEAATDLRPSGKVLAGGRRIEAVLETGFAAAGAKLIVVRAEANRVVVRPRAGEEGAAS